MEIVAKCAGTALLSTVVCILIKRINPELSFAAAAAAAAAKESSGFIRFMSMHTTVLSKAVPAHFATISMSIN